MSLKRISLSRPAALTLIVIISGGLGGCASAPPVAPPAPKVPYEQKMIWIFQLEDQRLITGRGRYVDDISMPGLAHMAILRSPYAHANIRSVDTSVYTCVVLIDAWPSTSCTTRMSAPWSSMWVAHECRSTCGLSLPSRPTWSA